MKLDFDIREFLCNLKATKPPYECPFEGCRKVYKSYIGMQFHLYKYDHNNGNSDGDSSKKCDKKGEKWHHRQNVGDGRSSSPDDCIGRCPREALTYAEAQKMVEFDIDGKVYRININEPLEVIHIVGKNGDIPIGDPKNCDVTPKKSIESVSVNSNKDMGKPGKGRTKSGKCSKSKKDLSVAKTPSVPSPQSTQTMKLPEPSFRIIEDYKAPDAPEKTSSYYRYIEKSPEENDEEVEYDMDEEDTVWLELVNTKRANDGLPEVTADTFEILMDRLEKESYFQSQNSGKDLGPAIDEDAVCCICNDGECQNSNAILFCDMCNLAVHQECYGVPYIPEGQWLCRRCLQSPSRAVECVLCPNVGGAFKMTDDSKWAHVVCALWIPEVCFANTVFLEPIDSIGNIPSARWKLSCYICKQRGVGACIQCHKANCYVAFHVTCAQQAGLYMKMEAVKEMTSSGVITNVRKAAFCDAHTPPDENGTSLNGVYSSGEEDSRSEMRRMQQSKAKFKEKMKKARKILAEKRSAIPVVSQPIIPLDRLTKIASLINNPKRNRFVQLLLGYWTLKRQSRNGVPLLRRLQVSHPTMRKTDGNNTNDDDEYIMMVKDQLKPLQRLRQDLEKARLLVELIRKREKLKREQVKNIQQLVEIQLNPFRSFLNNVLSKLQEKDPSNIFASPVDITEVADYLQFIEKPMDFSTIREKIETNQYTAFSMFEDDYNLIIKNCMAYNDKDTIYHKAALKLKENGQSIVREAKKKLSEFNERTGLFISMPHDIESNLNKDQNEELEFKLKHLQESLANARMAKSSGARTKRVRSLTAEIAEIQRQIRLNLNPQITAVSSPVKSPEKQKNSKSKSPKSKRSRMSDSDSTDIVECLSNRDAPFLSEGRKTLNSVSAGINSEFDSIVNTNPETNKNDSPKAKKKASRAKKSPLSLQNPNEHIRNGLASDKSNKKTQLGKRKLNGSTMSGPLSPDSNSSFSSVSNNEITSVDSNFAFKQKSQSSRSSNRKTADASTCTPPNMFTLTAESFAKEQATKGVTNQVTVPTNKRRNSKTQSRSRKRHQTSNSHQSSDVPIPFSPAGLPQSDSFRVYRNLNSPADSDINSDRSSHSSTSSSISTAISATSHSSDASSLGSSGTSGRISRGLLNRKASQKRPNSRSSPSDNSLDNLNIPLQPMDLVWAKCSGHPWYPAMIVDPDVPNIERNGFQIPKPPEDVLAIRCDKEKSPIYLVMFFDVKRTWQWLPRNKLEPLGHDQTVDQLKLREPRKAVEKKAVKMAFEQALITVIADNDV